MGDPQDDRAGSKTWKLSYASAFPPFSTPDTSTLAVVSALLSLLPSPCCVTGFLRLSVAPSNVPLIVPGSLHWSLLVESALPSLICFGLNCWAATRIRRSHGELCGMGWAVGGICFSLIWAVAAMFGVGLLMFGV
jgi:hypothetical protein